MTASQQRWLGSLLTAGSAYLIFRALYGSRYFFETRRYAIGQKDALRTLRIVHLTDLHFRERTWGYHRRLVKAIRELNPDLLLCSGDLIDQWGTAPPARRFLQWLPRELPKFAIPGNHDNKNRVSRATLRKLWQQCGGQLLVNETAKLRVQEVDIAVTGIDDFIEGESSFREAVQGLGREAHHFLLIHSPLQQESVLEDLARLNALRRPEDRLNIGYIFAGHNHGGQVRLGPLVPVLPKKSGGYLNGWYNKELPYLYVSKGFGTSCLPFRLGARAELTVFDYGVGDR